MFFAFDNYVSENWKERRKKFFPHQIQMAVRFGQTETTTISNILLDPVDPPPCILLILGINDYFGGLAPRCI